MPSTFLCLPMEVWLSIVFFNWDVEENDSASFFVWPQVCKSVNAQFTQKALPRYFQETIIFFTSKKIYGWPKRILSSIQSLSVSSSLNKDDVTLSLFGQMQNLRQLFLPARFYQSVFSDLTSIQTLELVKCANLVWDTCATNQQQIFPQLPSSLTELIASGFNSKNYGSIDLQKYTNLQTLSISGNHKNLSTCKILLPQDLTFFSVRGVKAPFKVNSNVLRSLQVSFLSFQLYLYNSDFPCLENAVLFNGNDHDPFVLFGSEDQDCDYWMLKRMPVLQNLRIVNLNDGIHTFQCSTLVHLGLYNSNATTKINLHLHMLPSLKMLILQSLTVKLDFGSGVPSLETIRLFDTRVINVSIAQWAQKAPALEWIILSDSLFSVIDFFLLTHGLEWKCQIVPLRSDHKMLYLDDLDEFAYMDTIRTESMENKV